MKQKMLVRLSCIFLVMQLFACHKIGWEEMWHKHNPDCRIEKILFYTEFGPDTVTGVFSYNHKGNPTSIILNQASTARPHHLFRYDHKGRLTDLIAPYLHNDAYEYWSRYVYDHKGRVVADTVHLFGSYINGQPLPSTYLSTVASYEYDAWDRIIKTVRSYPPEHGSLVFIDTYQYNSEGNLAVHQTLTAHGLLFEEVYSSYDNKVSMHRTNRLWMFMDRNYSKNNAVAAATYNSKGLPTKYDYDFGPYPDLRFLYSFDMKKSDIFYRCK